MTSRYRISVGGVQMDTLDKDLLILDIQHSQPDRNPKKQTTANLDGYDISDTYIGQRTVTVTFELHIYDTEKRNAACQKVNAWAQNGGVLIASDRKDQQLQNVICEQFADIASAKNWTDPLTLVFTTTSNPNWVSTTAKTKTLTGKGARGTLVLDGNTGSARVGVEVSSTEKITSLLIGCGSTSLKLTGLNIPAGQQVIVDYVKNRYLRITGGGASLMNKLDPNASSDLLLAECGKTSQISVTSNAKVNAVFTARGCWL